MKLQIPRHRPFSRLLFSLCALSVSVTAAETARTTALPPAEALAQFQLEPGLKIELVAAEPLVVDPVAFAFDDQRRLYVVENRGYPDPIGGTTDEPAPFLGRVALLEDTDGDGRYDRRAEFATDLSYPNGVLPWRGGVFVTCSPDIYYLKDLDGDGVADVRQVVLTGFDAGRTSQIRMSHPTLGLDGWVYVTSGLAGGKVRSPLHPERPEVSFSPADGRFHPDTFEFQTTGGRGQYGLTMDPFGRRFVSSNRHPVMHVVLEPWQLRRNPHLVFGETMQHVSKVDAEARVFPISNAVVTAGFIPSLMSSSHVGTFTSACSALIFNGTGLTAVHRGNAFICEPAQNLVQRQIVHPQGVSFRSELAYPDREFLASTDEWFRPVFLGHGPDGGLYIADMHRRVIDHPQYVPEESRGGLDFVSGGGDGRIYRVLRADAQPAAGNGGIGNSTAGIVHALESDEEWMRSTAHRLLLERRDPAAVPLLARSLTQSPRPETRAAALWLLDAQSALTPAQILAGLADNAPGVREQAVILAGRSFLTDTTILDTLVSLAGDPNARVRFQSALILGTVGTPAGLRALAALAARDGDDRWLRAVVLSGLNQRMPAFLEAFREQRGGNPRAFAAVMQDLGRLFGAGATLPDCRSLLVETLTSDAEPGPRVATVLGLVEGLAGRTEKGLPRERHLAALLGDDARAHEKSALEQFLRNAAALAATTEAPVTARASAAALLGYARFDETGAQLASLLGPQHPPEIQIAAVQALGRLGDPRAASALIHKDVWTRYTPRVREAVVAMLVSSPAFINVLLDEVEEQRIAASEISSTRRGRLTKHSVQAIRERAEALFKNLDGGDRMQVYQDYRSILTKQYEPTKGREPFMRACSACHTHGGIGGHVGPDLSAVRNQPADALLLHILVPNYEVIPAYQSISVETKDGRSITGWLVSETENSLTLRTAFGTEESVLRQNVATLTSSGLSLMPDGLEQAMTRDELGALIAFLKGPPSN